MRRMTKPQLENRVLEIVQTVVGGRRVEDDLTECKTQWPALPKASRQLAASANRAAGDEIVWIVGLDETAGKVTEIEPVEISNWTAQLYKPFPQGIYPELLHNFRVPVDENQHVIALVFDTARAPYVVRMANTPDFLEVPMREGTRTRSAWRSDLLRILVPKSLAPDAVPLSADLTIAVEEPEGAKPRVSARGTMRLFIEHLSERYVMLPRHTMAIEIDSGDGALLMNVGASEGAASLRQRDDRPPRPAPAYGVSVGRDGVLATGPGSVELWYETELDSDRAFTIMARKILPMRAEIGVLGSDAAIVVETNLDRDKGPSTKEYTGRSTVTTRWVLRQP